MLPNNLIMADVILEKVRHEAERERLIRAAKQGSGGRSWLWKLASLPSRLRAIWKPQQPSKEAVPQSGRLQAHPNELA